jgi:methylglutaconyl-CoA hydratase
MANLLIEIQDNIGILTLNNVDKHNAFDDTIIRTLTENIQSFIETTAIDVIVLKANGKHFSAGADANWMKKMATLSFDDNYNDAKALSTLMHTLYTAPKITVGICQGGAFGGGAGLLACCDLVFASTRASIAFPEVKLGLIPAVISPYVIDIIGKRKAMYYFLTGESMDAETAKNLTLFHQIYPEETLLQHAFSYITLLAHGPKETLRETKLLVHHVSHTHYDDNLRHHTVQAIATQRVSTEGQCGLHAFLNKTKPKWN